MGPLTSILFHFVNSVSNKLITSWNDSYWSAHNRIKLFVLVHYWGKRVVEYPEWESQVNSDIFVNLSWFFQQEFNYFNAYDTNDHGSCCCDGGNNFSSNKLYLKFVNLFDFIVSRLKLNKKLLSNWRHRP